MFVFLAYGTTATVSRRLGAGDVARAVSAGLDGLYLALGLGVVFAVAGWLAAPAAVAAFGAQPGTAAQAVTYLHVSMLGLPAMLLVLAATGILRGLQDTRTPLVVATVGFAANIVLNVVLVLGLGLGIAGSALGTVIAQAGMAVATVLAVLRGTGGLGAGLRPDLAGIRAAFVTGVPLLVRTLALRAALLATTWAATALGDQPLAAHQVAMTLWSFLALALDALAIAAQALTGRGLGAGDVPGVRRAMRRATAWSVGAGVLMGAGVAAAHTLLPPLFSTDPGVRSALAAALLVVAVGQPLAGYVFALDGVLIGAGDGRYLAVTGVATTVVYLPFVALVRAGGPPGPAGLVLLWVAFAGVWMGARALALGLRSRGTRWMVLGG